MRNELVTLWFVALCLTVGNGDLGSTETKIIVHRIITGNQTATDTAFFHLFLMLNA
jgi:hypothetical protein